MDDATFNDMLQQFTDSGAVGHDPLRGWTAGLDDTLIALPVMIASQADLAPAPMAAVPDPSAMGAQATIQQYATTTYYGNDSSTAPPRMLQQTMTTPVPPTFGYDWAAQAPLGMSYAGQATTAVYTTADAWNVLYSGPSFGAPPQQSAMLHSTAAVVQPLPPPLTVTHDYAASTDDHQSTYLAATSYVGLVVVAGAQSSAGSLPAPSQAHQTNGQRNSDAPSAPQEGPARTKYRLIAPKPAPSNTSSSAATPSTSTAPSPVPHAPGTPLFPAQAPRLVLAPYSGILRGAPPSALLDEAPMAVSLAMLAQPAPAHNTSGPPMAPPAKQPPQPSKKSRKPTTASTRRAQAAPAAASHVTVPPSMLTQTMLGPPEKLALPVGPRPVSTAVEVQAAPTATPLHRNAAPELAPSMQAPVPHNDAGPAAVVQGEEHTSEVAGAAPGQVVRQDGRQDESTARRATPAIQRKRGRPDAGSEIHSSTKRAVTDELWQTRSLDSEESSLPVGHRVQSGNNLVSLQRSHTPQRSSPSPPQGTGPRASSASAGPSSGTTRASGSRPSTSAGAAAGPSQPQGTATDDEEDEGGKKKGNKKVTKKLKAVDKSTNALGSLQAGLKWYSWMAP